MAKNHPRCIVIAGPNGAGKTTFAREYLPNEGKMLRFLNADLIAGGLSPLHPELAAFAAGKVFLAELERFATSREDFAFETTLSGRLYVTMFRKWKGAGYHLRVVYLRLPSARIAINRVRARVKQGGHSVPPADIKRRFRRSLDNFLYLYRPLADDWAVFDNSGTAPRMLEHS